MPDERDEAIELGLSYIPGNPHGPVKLRGASGRGRLPVPSRRKPVIQRETFAASSIPPVGRASIILTRASPVSTCERECPSRIEQPAVAPCKYGQRRFGIVWGARCAAALRMRRYPHRRIRACGLWSSREQLETERMSQDASFGVQSYDITLIPG